MIGALCCVLAMTVLGGSVSLSRLLVDFPSLSGQVVRYGVAAIALAALARLRGGGSKATRRDLVRLAALAATGLAAFNYFLLVALRHADAAIVGTVVAGTPLVLAVLGPALRRQRPSARLLGAAMVVVSGAGIVYGGGHADPVGLAAAVATLAGEVAFSVLAVPLLGRLGPTRVSAWSCALAVPLLGLAAIVAGEPGRWRVPTAAEAGVLAYLGLIVTVLAFPIWYGGVHRLGVERAGMFAALLPITTTATASTMDLTLPRPAQAAGALLVAAGLIGALAPVRPARAQPARGHPTRGHPTRGRATRGHPAAAIDVGLSRSR